jgi:hypothetical protein
MESLSHGERAPECNCAMTVAVYNTIFTEPDFLWLAERLEVLQFIAVMRHVTCLLRDPYTIPRSWCPCEMLGGLGKPSHGSVSFSSKISGGELRMLELSTSLRCARASCNEHSVVAFCFCSVAS